MFEKIKRLLAAIFGNNSLDYICGTEALPLPLSQDEESDRAVTKGRRPSLSNTISGL